MVMAKELGTRLRLLRESRAWTQKEVAREIAVAPTTYAGYESGERDPSTETLVKLAELFGVSIDYLCGLTSRPGYIGKRLRLSDYLAALPPDVRSWAASPNAPPYVLVAHEAFEGGLDAEALRAIVEVLRRELTRPRPRTRHEKKADTADTAGKDDPYAGRHRGNGPTHATIDPTAAGERSDEWGQPPTSEISTNRGWGGPGFLGKTRTGGGKAFSGRAGRVGNGLAS